VRRRRNASPNRPPFPGSGVPILGINIGYLGFITSVPGHKVKSAMRRILEADYIISRRTALDIEVETDGEVAVAGRSTTL